MVTRNLDKKVINILEQLINRHIVKWQLLISGKLNKIQLIFKIINLLLTRNKKYIFIHFLAIGNHLSYQFIILSGPCQHNSQYLLEANFAGSDTPVKSTGTQQGFQKEEHSRGPKMQHSRGCERCKRSTAGAPICSTAGAA